MGVDVERDALALPLPSELAGAVDTEVPCVDVPDLHLQRLGPHLPSRVVGGPGGLHHPADRLDPREPGKIVAGPELLKPNTATDEY